MLYGKLCLPICVQWPNRQEFEWPDRHFVPYFHEQKRIYSILFNCIEDGVLGSGENGGGQVGVAMLMKEIRGSVQKEKKYTDLSASEDT